MGGLSCRIRIDKRGLRHLCCLGCGLQSGLSGCFSGFGGRKIVACSLGILARFHFRFFAALQCGFSVLKQAFRRLVARCKPGDVLCQLTKGALAVLKHTRSVLCFAGRSFNGGRVTVFCGLQFLRFCPQCLQRLAGIRVQVALTGGVLRQLNDPSFEGFDRTKRACFFFVQRARLDLKPVQDRRRNGRFFTQRGQRLFRLCPVAGGLPRQALGFRRLARQFGKSGLGRGAGAFRISPAEIEQQAFSVAQFRADFPVTFGLPGLPCK